MAEKQLDNGSVWQSFAKIAAESGLITTNLNPENKDFVGNPSKSPTGPFRDNGGKREKGDAELYDVTDGSGEQLIEKAHPKSIQIADAMGAGGVVENQLEQQQKSMEIATKMPSGALYGVHAELVKELAKKANELEAQGKIKEAIRIDRTIKKITALPFSEGQVYKKAAWFIPALAWLGKALFSLKGMGFLAGVGAAGSMGFLSSAQEGLSEDAKEFYDALIDASKSGLIAKGKSISAERAAELFRPFLSSFVNLNLSNKDAIVRFLKAVDRFIVVLPQIKSLVKKVPLELGPAKFYEFGQDRTSKVMETYKDFLKSYEETVAAISNKTQEIKQQTESRMLPVAKNLVSKLQEILVDKGLLDKVSGTVDQATAMAALKLEKQIDKDLDALGIKRKSPFVGRIVSDGKIVIDPSKLQRILSLIEMAKSK